MAQSDGVMLEFDGDMAQSNKVMLEFDGVMAQSQRLMLVLGLKTPGKETP